jgi:hypothetical protein
MEPSANKRLTIFIDDDIARLAVTKRVIEAVVVEGDVIIVDEPEGRAAISFVENALVRPGSSGFTVLLVRAQPVSWTTVAIVTCIRARRGGDRVQIVVTTEGRADMLPVLLTDFPRLRIVTPDFDPSTIVAGIVESAFDCVYPVS